MYRLLPDIPLNSQHQYWYKHTLHEVASISSTSHRSIMYLWLAHVYL